MAFFNPKIFRERLSEPTSILFLVAIFFFLTQAVLSSFFESFPPLIDFFTVISLLIFAFILHLFYRFEKIVPIALSIGFLFHIAGLYKIIPYNPYYYGNLYGAPQLMYHYDWIVHTIGTGFLAIGFSSITYPYLKKAFRSRLAIFLIILLAVIGMGSLNEVAEFVGYGFYGYGEGFLEFGTGDFSPDSGPWSNTCTDMLNNIIGGAVFIGAFILIKKYNDLKSSKKNKKKIK